MASKIIDATARGLQCMAAGALCVPLGAFQWYILAESYDRAASVKEFLISEEGDPICRRRLYSEKTTYDSPPTLFDCISGMYDNIMPYHPRG